MDTPQTEQSFDENVKQIMEDLPPVIRAYLEQGKYSVVTKNLMAKYSLRIDQGGILEREIMLLIMGIEDPTEFVTALISEASIADDTARQILTDVNQEIFVPLRDGMRKGQGAVSTPPTLQSEPRPKGVGAVMTNVRPASAPLTPPPPPAPPAPAPVATVFRPAPRPMSPSAPTPPTKPATDSRKEAPETLSQAVSRVIQHPSLMPPPTPQQLPAHTEEPPPNLPRTAPHTKEKPIPPTKGYVNDPYREPLE
jgi:hypothetical protein